MSPRGRPPLRCPACKAAKPEGATWRLAPDALERVQAQFGLTHPLYVRRTSGRQQKGTYRGLDLGLCLSKTLEPLQTYHVICISSTLDPDMAARTLLHEACHAKQHEADPSALRGAAQRYRGHRRSVEQYMRYRNEPTEVEARAAESAVHRLPGLMISP